MKYFLLGVICCAVFFSGCIDIYFDIIHHIDNTYTLRRTIVLGQDFIGQMGYLQALVHDSTEVSLQSVADSIAGEFKNEKAIYVKYPGVLAYDLRDSVHDTTAFIITEIHLRDVKLLSELGNEHFFSLQQEDKPGSNRTIQLKTASAKGKTTFDFLLMPEKDLGALTKEDKETYAQYFGNHRIAFRIFSPDLIRPNPSKEVLEIAGGEEWQVPFTTFPAITKTHPKKVRFTLRNPAIKR
jgi:hypothetical protein